LCLTFAIAILCSPIRAQSPIPSAIVRLDPSLDQVLSADSKLDLLQGEAVFEGGEGSLWIQRGESGFLLFSEVGENRIFQWTPDCFVYPCGPGGKLSVFTEHSGYADASRVGSVDVAGAHLYGTNGLTNG
jgi:sugar lactone lactonase YvrE